MLFLGPPCVGCFRICLHKSNHFVIRIHGFEEVPEIYKNMYNAQYFVNLQDLAYSFTTKEFLHRCFAKTKVISYTAFFESAEQLLFGRISHGCLSLSLLAKRKQLPKTIDCSRSTIQKLGNL